MINIVPVDTSRLLGKFIDFPHDLYANDPNYVPELFVGQLDLLKPGKHPFFNHAEIKLFLAYQDDKIVGRIAAIVNNNHNDFTGRQDGFFGFFDSVNDSLVVKELFEAATAWLREKGLNTINGPVNFSTNDSCGVLIEGFNRPPVAMMPYNKPYYDALILGQGFSKKTDLMAYELNVSESNERSLRLLDTLTTRLSKKGITIRPVNLKDFKNEAIKIREVYNSAWDKNLGFVPMTKEEFEYLAKELKMIVDPRFCLVAEKDGEFIGWILGIPDINQILIKIKRGRLFPTGLFKLLTQRKNITRIRVMTLGILEPYRKMGIEACLYASVIKNTYGTKITGGECSWMLEENYLMNHAIEQLNGKLYKKYRLYEKSI
jgi:hypothetical protein